MFNWGIIGPGNIARVFCNGLRFSKSGKATAVASRDQEKAQNFAQMFSIPCVHSSYETLLADKSVDVVYIATIHPAHLEWVTKAAEAGKHILVEKPMGMNSAEVAKMITAAKENDVFLMEAFMYRCHPQIERMVGLIQDRAIGDVRVVRSAFGFHANFNPDSRTYSHGRWMLSIIRVKTGGRRRFRKTFSGSDRSKGFRPYRRIWGGLLYFCSPQIRKRCNRPNQHSGHLQHHRRNHRLWNRRHSHHTKSLVTIHTLPNCS